MGAAQAVREALAAKGWTPRIAVVSGDDVLPRLLDASTPSGDLAHLFTDEPVAQVRERLVFGNAYLGAAPIVKALTLGADIVITGRVADAALFLGPIVHSLGWDLKATDSRGLDRLAQGLTVGHLLECSGQGSGGNFGSQDAWKAIPDLAHIGFPIAEVWEDGTALITKAPGTGGRINFDTVRHHVYSFSPTKTFELKLYAGVPNAPVTFDKPGVAVLGCNIHDTMAAWVVVADTPWHARSGADGLARIDNVPAGAYRLRVWHPGLPPTPEPAATPLNVGTADLAQAVRLPVAGEP